MKNFFKQNTGGIIITLFGALVVFMLNILRDNSANTKRDIDCWENITYTDINELRDKHLQILFNGKHVNYLSSIDIELFNYSDKNFDNIPVYIEIIPAKGDTLQLIEENVLGIGESVNQINIDTTNKSKSSIKFSYMIKVANTADSIKQPIFNGNFSIVSSKKPTVNVKVIKNGLRQRPYDWIHFGSNWWESDIAILIYIIIGFIIYIIALIRIGNHLSSKRDDKWKTYLKQELTNKIKNQKVNLDAEQVNLEVEKFIATYKEINDSFDNGNPGFFKMLARKFRPSKDEIRQNDN